MFYFIVLFLGILFSFNYGVKYNEKHSSAEINNIKIGVVFFLYACVLCLHSVYVGTDTLNYSRIFRLIGKTGIKNIHKLEIYGKAPLWTLIMKFVSTLLGSSTNVYIFISGLLVILPLVYALKLLGEDTKASLTLYYILFLLPAMNGTRTAIAVAFFFLGIAFLYRKNIWASLVTLVMAFFIHKTVITAFPICLIFFKKIDIRVFAVMVVVFIGAMFFLDRFVEMFASHFTEYEDSIASNRNFTVGGKNVVYQIGYLLTAVYAVLVLRTKKLDSAVKDKIYKFSAVCVLEMAIAVVGMQSWYLIRINNYYQIFIIALIPMVFKYKKSCRNIILIIILSVFVFGFFYRIYTNAGDIYPYTTFLFNS